MAQLFWPVVLLTFAVLVGAVFGRPSWPLLIGSGLGALLFASGATYIWTENARMRRLAEPRFYSLEVEPAGVHVLRIPSLPGIPGMNVRPVVKATRRTYQSFGEERLPVGLEDIWACTWKVRPPGPSLHLHDASCRCHPKDYLLDTGLDERFSDGTIKAIELEYLVSDRTKPTLAVLDLQVGHPFTFGNDLAMGEAIGGIIATGFVGGAAVGLLGMICQALRLRRRGKKNGRGTLHSPLPQ